MGRRKDYRFEDRHHIVPTSRRGTDHPDNIVVMKRNFHEALHKLFQNDTPVEQYERLVELNQTVHTQQFLQALYDVLSWNSEEVYIEEVIEARRGHIVSDIYSLGVHEMERKPFRKIKGYRNERD